MSEPSVDDFEHISSASTTPEELIIPSRLSTILPPHLAPGATIAIISPSSRINEVFPKRLSRAVAFLKKIGFNVEVFYTPIPANATIRQSALHRAKEIHAAFSAPHISAIISSIGGLSANEVLTHLDYNLIRSNPKIFCGYSDITLLHYAIFTQAGLRTFYGPAAITQWAEHPQPLTLSAEHFLHVVKTTTNEVGQLPRSEQWTDEFLDWATDADLTRPRTLRDNPGWKWLRRGRAKGMMFGGCLPSILQLSATKYDLPSYHGVILFLELPEGQEDNKATPLEFAQSNLGDLANRGIFTQIAGLVLGRPYMYTDAMHEAWETCALQVCEGTAFPILAGVDVGHTDPMITVPLGAMGELDSEADRWAIVEPSVV